MVIPSFITDNIGTILLTALVLFGLNTAKNYGYDKRTREYEIQAAKEKESREAAVEKAEEEIAQERDEIQQRFADYEQQIAQLKKDIADGKKPAPVPTTVKVPKPPTKVVPTVVGQQDQIKDDKTEDPEQEYEEVIVEVPQELDIAWKAYDQLKHSGTPP